MSKHKLLLVITSLITISPLFIGLFLWKQLPAQLPVHFNQDGMADAYAGKPISIFVFPICFLLFHLFLLLFPIRNQTKNISNDKSFLFVAWIFPFIGIFDSAITYPKALGMDINITFILNLFISLLFIIMGYFLPRIPQNNFIGIKTPWTHKDNNNWICTHQMASKLWMFVGFILLLNTFVHYIPLWGVISLLLAIIIIPIAYSFVFYLKHKKIEA